MNHIVTHRDTFASPLDNIRSVPRSGVRTPPIHVGARRRDAANSRASVEPEDARPLEERSPAVVAGIRTRHDVEECGL